MLINEELIQYYINIGFRHGHMFMYVFESLCNKQFITALYECPSQVNHKIYLITLSFSFKFGQKKIQKNISKREDGEICLVKIIRIRD